MPMETEVLTMPPNSTLSMGLLWVQWIVGSKPWKVKPKDYSIGFCCFSTKHTTLRSKSYDWLTRNYDNVSEWSDMFTFPNGATCLHVDCCFSKIAL